MTQEIVKKDYIVRIAYDANLNPQYIGKALVKSQAGESVWQIKKITYDANLNPTKISYAEDSTAFDKEWDERTSYAYGY